MPRPDPIDSYEPADFQQWRQTFEYVVYQRTGHSLAILLHGLAGGLLAVVLAARSRADAERTTKEP